MTCEPLDWKKKFKFNLMFYMMFVMFYKKLKKKRKKEIVNWFIACSKLPFTQPHDNWIEYSTIQVIIQY